jgi:hypothetical protein
MTAGFRNVAHTSLDAFGQILIFLVAHLARPAYVPHGTRRRPVRRFLARHTIDGIVAIGRVVDQLNVGFATTDSKSFGGGVDAVRLKPDTTY